MSIHSPFTKRIPPDKKFHYVSFCTFLLFLQQVPILARTGETRKPQKKHPTGNHNILLFNIES